MNMWIFKIVILIFQTLHCAKILERLPINLTFKGKIWTDH